MRTTMGRLLKKQCHRRRFLCSSRAKRAKLGTKIVLKWQGPSSGTLSSSIATLHRQHSPGTSTRNARFGVCTAQRC